MQILPILGFYMKHGSQIEALIDKGGSPGQSHLVLDFAQALVPVLKKNWPQLNDNGLLDDALSTLTTMLVPPAEAPPRSIPHESH